MIVETTLKLKPIVFPQEETIYLAPSWEELAELTFEVAQKIIKDSRAFDRIVTLAKGGWPMTVSLVDFLKIPFAASFGLRSYDEMGHQLAESIVYQDIPPVVKDERVLLFDDIADTGKSFLYATDHLKRLKAKSITSACLFYKPHSAFTPDYHVIKTEAWIILPYEVREMVETLGKKWLKAGIDEVEIKRRFSELKFDPHQVEYYLKALR